MSVDIMAIAGSCDLALLAAEADLRLSARELIQAYEKEDSEQEDYSYMLQLQDNVGVVSIRGMLTNMTTPWNRYFGLVSYDEIRAASITALESGVGGLQYLIGSPGGRVAGMSAVADFISTVPVPTQAYTDETMASAALFLGIQADDVYAGDFANVGSVGVISVIMDYTEAMKNAGVVAKRFRSGDLKQVGNPMFKMTDKEEKYAMEQVQIYAQKFYNVVSQATGMPMAILEQLDITSGRTFIGQQAVQVGLVDGVMTFDQAYARIVDQANKVVDSRKNRAIF